MNLNPYFPIRNTMYKTVAVTGASGHIGNVVCRTLLESGYRVRALYHTHSDAIAGLPLESFQGDVLNMADLEQLFDGCEVVIHCAAIISIHGDPTGIVRSTNVEGTKMVLQACMNQGVKKLIHLSSVHAVKEQPLHEPYNEDRPYKTNKDFAYDFSKSFAEQMLLSRPSESTTDVVIIRPSAVVGPFDFRPSEIGKVLRDFYNQKLPVLTAGGYNFVDVRDVAKSIVQAIDKGSNNEVYLLSGKYYTIKHLAHIAESITGKRVPKLVLSFGMLKLFLPFFALYAKLSKASPSFTKEAITALQNGHLAMDNSKAAAALGHSSRPLEESVRDFYQWMDLKTINQSQ